MVATFPSENSAAPDQIRLAHYQLRQTLGEGGFGQVFEAWDSKLMRSVAIKRLKRDGLIGSNSDLLREARLAASLRHPAFVKIHALEEDENSQSIVMELVAGQTLKQLLASNAVSSDDALDIVRQVAQAMQQAHAAGLTHGDLKPSNLMREPDGTVRILDFGLAAQADPQATASMAQLDPQGTIAYMAPERLLGTALAPSSDIYALGVILYELWSGKRPYAELSGMALAAAQVHSSSEQWPYPPAMPAKLVQLIRAMTVKQPKQRLADMAQVLQGLDDFAAAKNSQVLPISQMQTIAAPESASITSRPVSAQAARPRLWWVAAGLLLGALVLWQLQPHWQPYLARLGEQVQPYSESQEMRQGLAALEQWDRPGNLDVASKHFSRVLDRQAENAAAVAGMGLVYHLRYQTDFQDPVWAEKATASAQQALQLNDQLALSHVAQARVYLQSRKGELALQSVERALQLDPENKFACLSKNDALVVLLRYDESIKVAQDCLQRNPQTRAFADSIGSSYFAQRKYREAEQAFRRSIAIQPDSVFAYANLSAALQRQNQSDAALSVLQQGLQVRPSYTLYTSLGNILFFKGNYVGAANAFQAGVDVKTGDPQRYLGWANLGDALLWIPGRSKDAQHAYQRAHDLLAPRVQREPNSPLWLSRLALYAARMGEKVEAESLLQRAAPLEPNNPDLRFRLGLAYELIGKREIALAEIGKALQLGYPRKALEAEPNLVELRRDSRFSQAPSGDK